MTNEPKHLTFPKSMRLLTNSRFKTVLENNMRFTDGLLVLFLAKNNCQHPRLGISVAKSCGSAVIRNRLKRLLREAFRQNQSKIPPGLDYLLMVSPHWTKVFGESITARQAVKKLRLEKIEKSFLALIAGSGVK